MSDALVIAAIAGWVACGVLDACWWYAYMQREYRIIADFTRRHDTVSSLVMGLAGPMALLASLLTLGPDLFRHGLLFPGRRP